MSSDSKNEGLVLVVGFSLAEELLFYSLNMQALYCIKKEGNSRIQQTRTQNTGSTNNAPRKIVKDFFISKYIEQIVLQPMKQLVIKLYM